MIITKVKCVTNKGEVLYLIYMHSEDGRFHIFLDDDNNEVRYVNNFTFVSEVEFKKIKI